MKKIRVLSACKTTDKALLQIERDYLVRFGGQMQVELLELGLEKHSKLGADQQRAKATELVLEAHSSKEALFILDESGKQYSSFHFARELEKVMNSGVSSFAFAIGGAYGIEKPSTNHRTLSLSPMTMPHQLCRVVLIEQLYRAFSILQGHPYHKE